MKFNMEQKK